MTTRTRILLDFRFDVREPPRYGRLERLRGLGKWVSTKRFYSRQLEKGKVRYVHIPRSSSSVSDSFRFIVTVPSNPSSTTTTPATSSSIVAYIENVFKIDIISNAIRVRKLSIMVLLLWLFFLLLSSNIFSCHFCLSLLQLNPILLGLWKDVFTRGRPLSPPLFFWLWGYQKPKTELLHIFGTKNYLKSHFGHF